MANLLSTFDSLVTGELDFCDQAGHHYLVEVLDGSLQDLTLQVGLIRTTKRVTYFELGRFDSAWWSHLG